jgi:hypothetical protein
MARVKVVADDGWVALDELATAEQMASEHYRRCLSDRIQWAVGDAQQRAAGARVLDGATRIAAPAAPALIAA